MESHPNRQDASQKGISLVELMIASTIVMVLLLATSMAVVSQSRLRRTTEQRNLAMVAARNTIESIHNTAFSSLPALNGSGFDVRGVNGAPGGLQPVPGDADGLPGSITITVDQSSGTELLYMATVAVDWNGSGGIQKFELRTLVAQRK